MVAVLDDGNVDIDGIAIFKLLDELGVLATGS